MGRQAKTMRAAREEEAWLPFLRRDFRFSSSRFHSAMTSGLLAPKCTFMRFADAAIGQGLILMAAQHYAGEIMPRYWQMYCILFSWRG